MQNTAGMTRWMTAVTTVPTDSFLLEAGELAIISSYA